MAKISRKVRTNKKSKSTISATVLKTKIRLMIDNIELNLTRVQAERIQFVLGRALVIQDSQRR